MGLHSKGGYCRHTFRYTRVFPDDCASSPCQHGGSCWDRIGDFHCTCPVGYEGKMCEKVADPCLKGVCRNGAECISNAEEAGGYACKCAGPYVGKHCEIQTVACTANPCLNGASCINALGFFKCLCPEGFTGENVFKCSHN